MRRKYPRRKMPRGGDVHANKTNAVNGWPKSFVTFVGTYGLRQALRWLPGYWWGQSSECARPRPRSSEVLQGDAARAPRERGFFIIEKLKVEVFEHASGRMASEINVGFWCGLGHVVHDRPQCCVSSDHARAHVVLF